MKCGFSNKWDKECNIKCEYYHTCTRSEYNKKESREHGEQQRLGKTSQKTIR